MLEGEGIVTHMLENDLFSKWLGIEVVECSNSLVSLQLVVREEMTNGHKVAHGGIIYSLADSTLAFTVNFHGLKAMSTDTSVSHLKPVFKGDVLRSSSQIKKMGKTLAWIDVDIFNQKDELVAQFRGTAYRSSDNW